MKTYHPLLLLFTALLTMNVHCEKDDPEVDFTNSQNQLPPITTSGANTFGCTVNGKNWVAYTDYSFPKLRVSYDEGNGSFSVVANRKKLGKDDDDALNFNMGSVNSVGAFPLGHYLSRGYMLYSPPYSFAYQYTTDSVRTGKQEIIKIDRNARIISGKFEADLIYYDPNISDSIIQIRNGRFDVKY